MVLEREDVNLNTADDDGETPFLFFGAAYEGHEGVSKLLLERNDVNPNIANSSSETPLHGRQERI